MQTFFGAAAPLDPASHALTRAQIARSPSPWNRVADMTVGGLTALGFDRNSELLLVTSTKGQSIISGQTGEVLYRNRDADGLDIESLKGTRMDHPAEERFDMAGQYGGALRTGTHDGWAIIQIPTPDCVKCVLLPTGATLQTTPPKADANGKDLNPHLLACPQDELRAFGFSWSGRSLVVATASGLSLWARPAPLTL